MKKLYMVYASKLKPGDIILTSEKSKLSLLIRLGLWSRFSHVSMVVLGGLYVEALGIGVRARSLNTILVNHIKVLRYGDVDKAHNASEAIMEYLHSKYWLNGAWKSRFRANRKESKTLFCSNLVAQAFSDVDSPISSISPMNITPKDIENSSHFTDITTSVSFRPKYIPMHLKQDDFQTVSDVETLRMQKVCLSVELWAGNQGINIPNGFLNILKYLYSMDDEGLQKRLDVAIIEAINEQKLLDIILYARDEVIEPLGLVYKNLKKKRHSKEAVSVDYYLMEGGHASLLKSQEVLEDNLGLYKDLYQQSGLMTFEFMIAYTKAMLEQHEYVIRYIVGICNYYYVTYPEYFK